MHIGIVGAGLSSAVIARELAEKNYTVSVFEKRNHVAGNCHTLRDSLSQIMIHIYGPHIFHTDDNEVWSYVTNFMEFIPFVNRVKATTNGQVYSLPINLHTINQFFGKALSPMQAQEYIKSQASTSTSEPANFEEQALHLVGSDLYKAFFRGYTRKQWGVDPKNLPASILKRLPVRFNYNDNYFFHKHQGIPKDGYTILVERILNHQNISIKLETEFTKSMCSQFDHVFYSGEIDKFYNYDLGRLPYRTLDFIKTKHIGDFQGCAVMNYCDESVLFTRITEHKHFAPWENHESSICYTEYSRECGQDDIPYYPIHMAHGDTRLENYINKAKTEPNVTFVGRLGTYRYMDMDVTIRAALDTARTWCAKHPY